MFCPDPCEPLKMVRYHSCDCVILCGTVDHKIGRLSRSLIQSHGPFNSRKTSLADGKRGSHREQMWSTELPNQLKESKKGVGVGFREGKQSRKKIQEQRKKRKVDQKKPHNPLN